MNRSNVGNVVTNGMQVLSVAANNAGGNTTRILGQANKSLNSSNSAGGELDAQTKQAKLENMQANTEKVKLKNEVLKNQQKQTVDSLMSDVETNYNNNSEQIKDVTTKIKNDYEFVKMMKDKQGRFYKPLYTKKEVI